MVKTSELILNDDNITDVWEPGAGDAPIEKTGAEKAADALVDALREDSEAYVMVYLQPEGGKSSMEFVKRIPADKFDMGQLQAYLQENFGGGDYRIMIRAGGKVRANKLITIKSQIKRGDNAPTQTGELGQFMTGVMDRMETMQNNMLQMMQGNQNGGNSRQEMLNEMMLMKNLFSNDNGGGNASPMAGMKELFEMQALFKDSIVGDGKEDNDGFGSLLEKSTPLFEAILNNQSQVQTPPQQVQPTEEQKKQHMIKQQQKKIIGGIKQLIMMARVNGDPGTAAEMTLEKLPEQAIQAFVIGPNALENVCKIVPDVASVKEWFLMLGEHAKAQLGLPSLVSEQYDEPLTGDNSGDSVAGNDLDAETTPENGTDLHPKSDT